MKDLGMAPLPLPSRTSLLRLFKRAIRRVLSTALRWLPVSSRSIGPPKGLIADFCAWAEEVDRPMPSTEKGWRHWCIKVREEEVVESRPPLTLEGPVDPTYAEGQLYRYPPLFVGHLRRGRLALREGVVISPDDRVFDEFTYYWGRKPASLPVFERVRLPPVRRMIGPCATILSPGSVAPNYYHWLVETLPRLGLLELAGLHHYQLIVPQEMAPWQWESLEMLGYGRDRLVPFGDDHWEVDSLLIPSLLGFSGMCRPWAASWLRERLGVPEKRRGRRRLYISRSRASHRHLVNEEEVAATLQGLGFEIVFMEGMTLAQQIGLFSQARFIISLHGAGLTNALFAPRGACVIEFMSSVPAFMNTCFYSICAALGHKYLYLYGEHPGATDRTGEVRRWRPDLRVAVDEVAAAVRRLEQA